MATNNTSLREPENFSNITGLVSTSRIDLPRGSEEQTELKSQKSRFITNDLRNCNPPSVHVQPLRPLYASYQENFSASSLQNYNYSRPSSNSSANRAEPAPRPSHQAPIQKKSNTDYNSHGRKHSCTQGSFEAYVPTTADNNYGSLANPTSGLSTSHIAAQAAMQYKTHVRQRSQTVPSPQIENKRRILTTGHSNPPMSSLTETSVPQDSRLGNKVFHSSNVGVSHKSAAQTAASVVFPKSPNTSPGLPPSEYLAEKEKEKPVKAEKSKVKLFSRPGKNGTSKDKEAKTGPFPSPNKVNFPSAQKANYSAISALETQSSTLSMHTITNSFSSSIRPFEPEEKKLEKEKHKHNFLSRQKHKLISKDDHSVPIILGASNSKSVDPNASSNLYDLNMPPSPSVNPNSIYSRSMSGLDLRHGGRALREKRKEKEEKTESTLREVEASYHNNPSEKAGTSSSGPTYATSFLAASGISYASSICGYDTSAEIMKNVLDRLGPEDAWPFLRTKLMAVFEGEDLKLPVEDLNRVVSLHLQSAHRKRAQSRNPTDDLIDLLNSGFTLLDQSTRYTPDEHLIPQLVEMWNFTFTAILPFMQAVFLPLDLELSKIMCDDEENGDSQGDFSVRSMVLRSYRDVVILSRFDILKPLFSKLHLKIISSNIPGQGILSPLSESNSGRPSTPMSLDPGIASYGSQANTIIDSISQFSRERRLSSVSSKPFAESPSTSGLNSIHPYERERAIGNSGALVAGIISRLLQCIGVLNSVHNSAVDTNDGESIKEKMGELVKSLKLDWLEVQKMGHANRGPIGARVRLPVLIFGTAIEV
ncbi:putative HbrB [Golovinomyces cichoracearum]|uniref:Putative HbrB n=1 Tax=Golovinomyces cichoracearum TaxID=62708 RepID=A0A420IFH6_9PEZI|nr:putative HbrB [Golovinomyces cichoracearum]